MRLLLFEVGFVILCVINSVVCKLEPIVTIPQGTLQGVHLTSSFGRTFSAFMSVPFAEPPVGPLRFKAPVAAATWKGVRNATEDSPLCIQNNPYIRVDEISGTEDCLYLNVYTPRVSSFEDQPPLPVMVFFHGGGWMCGSGNKMFYGPDHLMDRNVILVGVNYRLGPMAYLSTMDLAAPGNFALKDQNLALRWIQKNIKYFGGDCDAVTIFGESAGGASVHYHMMSPKSKGLFHRAIAESGLSLNVWANAVPGVSEIRAKKLAEATNCTTEDTFKMVECLRTVPAEDLISASSIFYEWDYDPMIPFKPVVEIDHEDAFLTEDPRVLLAKGKFHQVPFMVGLNAKEGAIKSANMFGLPHLRVELSEKFDSVAPFTFDYYHATDVKYITKAIKDFYLGGSNVITNETTDPLTDIYTDTLFLEGINEALQLQLPVSKEPIYFYYFNYRGQYSFSKVFGDPWRNYGPSHVDELIYIFNLGLFPPKFNEEDGKVSDLLLTLWTNFATSGDPNLPHKPQGIDFPAWKPLNSVTEFEYYSLEATPFMGNRLLEKRRKFWETLPLWPKHHSSVYTKKMEKNEL